MHGRILSTYDEHMTSHCYNCHLGEPRLNSGLSYH